MDITHDLNTLERITGINNEVLARMIEEKRIQAEVRNGVYCITRDGFIKWAEAVIDQMQLTQW